MSGEFGRIVTDDMVEDAVMVVLKRWCSTYLAEVEENAGVDRMFYKRPASWMVRNDMDKWPEELLPAIIVVSTGLADAPVKEGRGAFRAKWLIGVAAVVSSTEQDLSRRFAYRLGAALRMVMIQKQSLDGALDGTVRGITWLDGRNNELPQPEPGQRTIWATRQMFSVEVGDVGFQNAGPTSPVPEPDPSAPYPDAPTVGADKATVSITKEPING